MGNMAKIKGCEIRQTNTAIEVISAQPTIMMCTLENNNETGIISMTKFGLRCDAKIKYCTIQRNKEFGIIVTGANNFTRIEQNLTISENTRAGIKVENDAYASIVQNKIEQNFAQGILITESTYAHIEANTIAKNYKANIALGGPKASDCVILKNQILSSRQEGVFMIEVGFCWLIRNTISDNADGILMFDSNPNIENNQINNNMRAGIVCTGASFPKVTSNNIFGNHQTGINFRDNSIGSLVGNKIFKNYY
jgi:parallel beta-helix repeat protein